MVKDSELPIETMLADWIARPVRWCLVLVAVGSALAYLVVALQRVAYPYDIDFVEDGMLMQALRVATGQPIFIAPNAEFAPHVYMPLTTWLGGMAFRLTGPSFLPLRLLSLGATLATAGLIVAIARRESRSWFLAAVSGCLYLAGYRIAGGWYDLARVDALFVALALAGSAAAIYWHGRPAGQVVAALLLALSYLAKQNGLAFGLLAAGYLLLVVGQRAWPFVVAFAVFAAVPTLLLQTSSGGWFATYVFGIAFASPTELGRALYTLGAEVFGDMAVLAVMFLVLAASALILYRSRLLHEQPWLLFIAAAILASVAGRASVGGARNQLMQAYAFLCLTPALLWREMANWRKPERARTVVELALLLQFGLTLLSPVGRLIRPEQPQRYVPTAAMRASGDRLVARVAAMPGDVLVMMHPFYAYEAGKPPAAQIQALWHARWRGRDPLPADFVARIQNRDYSAIISDQSPYFETEPALLALIDANYVLSETLDIEDSPPTMSGLIVRPKVIYVPR